MIELTENINKETMDKDAKIQELKNIINDLEKQLEKFQDNPKPKDTDLEKKAIDRTVELNRLLIHKTRFIDNLSHDLATPLTPLVSLLPMIKQSVEDPNTKELIDVCIRNAEYIKRVVSNAKELADIGSTDFLLKKENLYEIINELAKKYDTIFRTCNIKVENNITQDVFVKTEKSRLLQLFDHISSNAVNSMLEKGGTITFDSKIVNRDGGSFIQISIRDTGVGLTRDQSDRLFDEFYKTDDSRHKLDSTGLGLAICKNIVEKHGGKIWAESHGKNTGATIHFIIPSSEVAFTRSF